MDITVFTELNSFSHPHRRDMRRPHRLRTQQPSERGRNPHAPDRGTGGGAHHGCFQIRLFRRDHLKGVALDPSRIAAQIVTGVGFLGAGMIFVRNQTISGLTTAAGVWATAGIGMTIGAGLYFLGGVAATLLIVAAQMTPTKTFTWLNFPVAEQISMEIEDTGTVSPPSDKLLSHNLEIISMKSRNNGNGLISLDLYVKLPRITT